MESWIPSPGNLALLQLLKDQVRVEWMFHVDVDPSTLPLGAPVLDIARHFVPKDSEGRFGELLNSTKHPLAKRIGGKQLVRGGWRIEKHDERAEPEEWVVFSGWESPEEHVKLAKTEGSKEYVGIREVVKRSEVRSAVRLEVEKGP
jgi:hypothetical protein